MHGVNPAHLPDAQKMVEDQGPLEHGAHVPYTAGVSLAKGPVEGPGFIEQAEHAGHLAPIPLTQGLVKNRDTYQ